MLSYWKTGVWDSLKESFHCHPITRQKGFRISTDLLNAVSAISFAGDTGYSPVFKEIGDRFGPIQFSMIPIGAYRPRWFMSPVHVDPPEAIQILKESRSERAIAGHWGTFKLSDEPLGEPLVYLRKALRENGIDEGRFVIMKLGETLRLSSEGVLGRMIH